jgi:CHASE2 domain-containing sensor protein
METSLGTQAALRSWEQPLPDRPQGNGDIRPIPTRTEVELEDVPKIQVRTQQTDSLISALSDQKGKAQES